LVATLLGDPLLNIVQVVLPDVDSVEDSIKAKLLVLGDESRSLSLTLIDLPLQFDKRQFVELLEKLIAGSITLSHVTRMVTLQAKSI
jgi:hypothetical protein